MLVAGSLELRKRARPHLAPGKQGKINYCVKMHKMLRISDIGAEENAQFFTSVAGIYHPNAAHRGCG